MLPAGLNYVKLLSSTSFACFIDEKTIKIGSIRHLATNFASPNSQIV